MKANKRVLGEFDIRIIEKSEGAWMATIQFRDNPPDFYGDKEPYPSAQAAMQALIEKQDDTPHMEKAVKRSYHKNLKPRGPVADDDWMG